MWKEIFIARNRITLQAAILDCSVAAFLSHPFSKISPGNIGGRVPSFGQITDWLLRVAIIYQNDSTKNVFLEIFRKILEQLNMIDFKYFR